MSILREYLLTAMKSFGRFLVNEGPMLAGILYLAGTAAEACGFRSIAVQVYALAIRRGDGSRNRRIFKVRQKWEFALERCYARQSRKRVEDPLHECEVQRTKDANVSLRSRGRAPGHFQAYWSFRGLVVEGFVRSSAAQATVQVLVDEIVVREFRLARIGAPFPPFFQVVLQRSVVARLPRDAKLEVKLSCGKPLLFKGSTSARLLVPHGSADLLAILSRGGAIDKKGFLSIYPERDASQSQALLHAYAEAKRVFEEVCGKPLFLLYGTLLGTYRDGDLIPSDDDFDVGYVSTLEGPQAVKEEAMEIAVALARAGLVVSFNRNGRPFRLRLPGSPPDTHLDVHVVWFEDGMAWIHPRARLPLGVEHFLPVRDTLLRDAEVALPALPEAFLQEYYGDSWRVPDPTYTTEARPLSRNTKNRLAKVCITPVDFQSMNRKLRTAPDEAAMGRLISIGSSSLYPIQDYEANYDW